MRNHLRTIVVGFLIVAAALGACGGPVVQSSAENECLRSGGTWRSGSCEPRTGGY